jgi:translin
MIPDLKKIEEKVLKLEHGRDLVMQQSRELIREAGKAIAFMHAYGATKAAGHIRRLKKLKSALSAVDSGFEYYSLQAHQEYSEALILHNILTRGKLPDMKEVGEGEVPYLLGLMDVIGELKRESIESIRRKEYAKARSYYEIMSDIYDSTLHMRFANSILPDFRRKQDSARIQLESVMNEMLRIGR